MREGKQASLWPHPQDAASGQREGAEPRERGETQPQPAATRPAFGGGHQASEAKLSARKISHWLLQKPPFTEPPEPRRGPTGVWQLHGQTSARAARSHC